MGTRKYKGGGNMVKHFIVMSSAYSMGKRIALDYSRQDELQMDDIKKDIDYIKNECGEDVPISTHFIQTDDFGWDKVVELDKFFEKAELIDTKEKFVIILKKDRILSGIDVARYILTKVPCTHLKLEKLVYMCYAEYLCEFKEKLFNDKIYAYRLGPVVETVYERYKMYGSEYIDGEDDKITYNEVDKKMPIKSRILASQDGLKKIISIDKTLENYSKLSSSDLVKLTHKYSTPWSLSGEGRVSNKEIEDDLILKYHKYEKLY